MRLATHSLIFFFQAEDGIRDVAVTGVQTCALPIYAVADARHGERLGWIVAPGGATNERVARADREEDFGERGKERHDAPGGRGERHPSTRVVGDGDAALDRDVFSRRAGRDGQRDKTREVGPLYPAAHNENAHPRRSGDGLASAPGAQRHHPSREGSAGGANGERLLASGGRLAFPSERHPVACEPLRRARHSGGAAPAPHPLPSDTLPLFGPPSPYPQK